MPSPNFKSGVNDIWKNQTPKMKSYQNPLSLVLTKMKLLSSSLLPSLNHQRRRPSVRQSQSLRLMRVWRWCSWWRMARSRCYRMLDPRMIILPEIVETENGGLTTAMEGFVVATEGSSHCFPTGGTFGGVSTATSAGQGDPFETCSQYGNEAAYCWTKSYGYWRRWRRWG